MGLAAAGIVGGAGRAFEPQIDQERAEELATESPSPGARIVAKVHSPLLSEAIRHFPA